MQARCTNPPAAQQSESSEAAAATDVSSDFGGSLKSLVGQKGAATLQAGHVTVIGLDRVKERLGKNWERLAGRVDRIARNTIERYLLPGDIFTSWPGSGYVIVFATLDPERARMKCVLIAEEVMRTLLGEEGADLISVTSAVAQLDHFLSSRPSEPTSPPASPAVEFVPVVSEPSPPEPMPAPQESAPAAKITMPQRGDLLGDFCFAYRPMWDAKRNVLSANLCIAALPTSNGDTEFALGDDVGMMECLDFAIAQRVIRDLARMGDEGTRALVILCVHFETLSSAARRRRYVQTLHALPAAAKELLVIEISDVPDGVPEPRMQELVVALRPFCRGVSARLRLETVDFNVFRACNAHAVGCCIEDALASEVSIIRKMERFSRTAEKAGLVTFIHRTRSVSLMAAAVGAGFCFIDGAMVATLVDHPRHVTRFTLGDVYRAAIRA